MPAILLRSHLEDAIFMAGGVRLLRGGSPEGDITRHVATRLANPSQILYRSALDNRPAFCYVGDSITGFLFIDGTSLWSQAGFIFDGYRSPTFALPTDSVINGSFNTASRSIWETITAVTPWPHILYAGGWSFGGAVAYLLPSQKRSSELPINGYRLHTFGMPRACGQDLCILRDGAIDHVRWMNDNDPVPLVPPRVSDFPAILPLFGIADAIRASKFVQPRGGVSIDAGGNWHASEVPSSAVANFTGAMRDWLYAYDNNGPLPHAITEYIGRLNAALLRATANERLDVGKREPEEAPGAREVNAVERQFLEQVHNLDHAQTSPRLQIPSVNRFKAQRIGRVYYVVWNGTVVATTGNKRKAKRMARQGNAWLDTLQVMAVVDGDAFGLNFRDYLIQASTANSGFVPTMNMVQPTP